MVMLCSKGFGVLFVSYEKSLVSIFSLLGRTTSGQAAQNAVHGVVNDVRKPLEVEVDKSEFRQ